MNIKITGKGLEVTDAMKDYIEKRLERLEKFEGRNTDVNVVCSVEREDQIVEMQVNHEGEFIRIQEKNVDFYASVDLAIDKVERQMRKGKEKRNDRNKRDSLKAKIMGMFAAEESSEAGAITKTKHYEIKPITVEDAKLKLDEKDDMFLAFLNVDTNQVNVIYQRGDGTYGIVVPE
ncbi:MAG: ribosome-associated translation inhibitor RaiA [Clostridia bacterium]|nr:ribosome-associated translation inhibitor RaiA [Clostridia bacterium]